MALVLSEVPLKRRILLMRWLVPTALVAVTLAFQLWSLQLAHTLYGATEHAVFEFLFYAALGPLIVYVALTRLSRWVDAMDEAENRARASDQRLAAIVSASADAILSLGGDGRILSWNRGAELIFGYTAEAAVGRHLWDLMESPEAGEVEFAWLVDGVRTDGFVRGHETTCRSASGQRVSVELTATRVAAGSGDGLAMSVILRDVTDRVRRDVELRHLNTRLQGQVEDQTAELAEKVEALALANAELEKLDSVRSEFLSLVSHQLRAPLTNMVGAVERMECDCPAMTVTCTRMVPILNQQIGRLERLVSGLLNMTRIESGTLVVEPEPISLLPIAHQVVDQLRTRATQRPIRLPTKPGLPLVFADRDQVAEVLANLLDNADKYAPAATAVEVDVWADESEVTLSVRDFGPGLPSTDLERVFDKFRRLDGSDAQPVYGSGLGLYICRLLVEAQGGRIWAENGAGGGAIFSFALPRAADG
jgi:PAS domain S-box-containing protein